MYSENGSMTQAKSNYDLLRESVGCAIADGVRNLLKACQ